MLKTTACKLIAKKWRKKIDDGGSLHRISPIRRER